jgi:hypothetical protein
MRKNRRSQMKRFILAVIITMVWVSVSLAAGTVVVTKGAYLDGENKTLLFTWTAGTGGDAGTVTAVPTTTEETNYIKGYYLCAAITNPGATTPADNYGITVKNADGIDLFGGALLNRDESNSEYAVPTIATGVKGCAFVDGTLTVAWTSVTTSAGNGTLKLFFAKP